MHRPYCREVLDHLGLVAGMFDELGIGDVRDRTMQHTPETRLVTGGGAVKAMVLNGLGLMNQPLDLVPMFCQNKPTQRLIAPGIDAQHLHEDTLGRAFNILYADGVTELDSRIAATAAQRLGLAPTFAHLDSTSFHVDGRYKSAEEPEEQVIHLTRGYSRDHRPDLNHVLRELIVEHQAGIPLLMKPLSGHSHEGQAFGQIVSEHIQPLQTTSGTTDLVADSALYSAENLQTLAKTGRKWITRVPATITAAQDALAHADPGTMAPLGEGSRDHMLTSTDGGVAQRWMLCDAAHRQPQAQRSVDQHGLKQSESAAKAWQKLCRTPFAWAADAQHARAPFVHGLQTASLHEGTIHPRPCYGKRGRPRPGAPPTQVVSHISGALTSSLAAHEALVAPQSCFILATNALDEHRCPPQELLAGYKGQQHAERGFRCLKDPGFLASSLYLKTPERMMALLMVMTVCLLVYAALESRIRKALKDHEATFPNQKGALVQNPTARWVFQYFVGIHLLRIRGEGAFVLNLNAQHLHLLRLLGRPYEAFYS